VSGAELAATVLAPVALGLLGFVEPTPCRRQAGSRLGSPMPRSACCTSPGAQAGRCARSAHRSGGLASEAARFVYPIWAMAAMAVSVTAIFLNSLYGRPRLFFDAVLSVERGGLPSPAH
jgi:hypothetical protein